MFKDKRGMFKCGAEVQLELINKFLNTGGDELFSAITGGRVKRLLLFLKKVLSLQSESRGMSRQLSQADGPGTWLVFRPCPWKSASGEPQHSSVRAILISKCPSLPKHNT